jgi:hypothetical protein
MPKSRNGLGSELSHIPSKKIELPVALLLYLPFPESVGHFTAHLHAGEKPCLSRIARPSSDKTRSMNLWLCAEYIESCIIARVLADDIVLIRYIDLFHFSCQIPGDV